MMVSQSTITVAYSRAAKRTLSGRAVLDQFNKLFHQQMCAIEPYKRHLIDAMFVIMHVIMCVVTTTNAKCCL